MLWMSALRFPPCPPATECVQALHAHTRLLHHRATRHPHVPARWVVAWVCVGALAVFPGCLHGCYCTTGQQYVINVGCASLPVLHSARFMCLKAMAATCHPQLLQWSSAPSSWATTSTSATTCRRRRRLQRRRCGAASGAPHVAAISHRAFGFASTPSPQCCASQLAIRHDH